MDNRDRFWLVDDQRPQTPNKPSTNPAKNGILRNIIIVNIIIANVTWDIHAVAGNSSRSQALFVSYN